MPVSAGFKGWDILAIHPGRAGIDMKNRKSRHSVKSSASFTSSSAPDTVPQRSIRTTFRLGAQGHDQEFIFPYARTGNERTKAAARFWLLGLIQFGLGLCLLIIGGIAASFHGDTTKTGTKYYTGAFLVGGFIILQSGFSMVIYSIEGPWYGKYSTLMNCITCLIGFSFFRAAVTCSVRDRTSEFEQSSETITIHLYAVSAVINCVLCLAGLIITGVAGICSSGDCSYEQNTTKNYNMAAIILTFIFLVLATCVCSFILLHTSQSGFGVTVFPFGQNRVADVETNQPRAATSYQPPGNQAGGHDQPVHQPHQRIPSAPPPPYSP